MDRGYEFGRKIVHGRTSVYATIVTPLELPSCPTVPALEDTGLTYAGVVMRQMPSGSYSADDLVNLGADPLDELLAGDHPGTAVAQP